MGRKWCLEEGAAMTAEPQDDLIPEEMLIDFEPDEEWWRHYLEWAEKCCEEAEYQYQREQQAEREQE